MFCETKANEDNFLYKFDCQVIVYIIISPTVHVKFSKQRKRYVDNFRFTISILSVALFIIFPPSFVKEIYITSLKENKSLCMGHHVICVVVD